KVDVNKEIEGMITLQLSKADINYNEEISIPITITSSPGPLSPQTFDSEALYLKVKNLESKVKEYEAKMNEYEKEIKNLQGQIAKLKEKISQLGGEKNFLDLLKDNIWLIFVLGFTAFFVFRKFLKKSKDTERGMKKTTSLATAPVESIQSQAGVEPSQNYKQVKKEDDKKLSPDETKTIEREEIKPPPDQQSTGKVSTEPSRLQGTPSTKSIIRTGKNVNGSPQKDETIPVEKKEMETPQPPIKPGEPEKKISPPLDHKEPEYSFTLRPKTGSPLTVDDKFWIDKEKSGYYPINLEDIWKDTLVSTVYFKHECIIDMNLVVIESHRNRYKTPETAGFLLGNYIPHKDEKGNQVFDVVCDIFVPAKHTRSTQVEVEFTSETFDYLADQMKEYPGLKTVGWFHTHPGLTAFLSNLDKDIHFNYFPEEWKIAVVIDSKSDQLGIFTWGAGNRLNHEPTGLIKRDFPGWKLLIDLITQGQ
ncbi:MAG: Mov34/MPN/PAD-1 family protein, partial [Candidatus Aminicenantes bacterium]